MKKKLSMLVLSFLLCFIPTFKVSAYSNVEGMKMNVVNDRMVEVNEGGEKYFIVIEENTEGDSVSKIYDKSFSLIGSVTADSKLNEVIYQDAEETIMNEEVIKAQENGYSKDQGTLSTSNGFCSIVGAKQGYYSYKISYAKMCDKAGKALGKVALVAAILSVVGSVVVLSDYIFNTVMAALSVAVGQGSDISYLKNHGVILKGPKICT